MNQQTNHTYYRSKVYNRTQNQKKTHQIIQTKEQLMLYLKDFVWSYVFCLVFCMFFVKEVKVKHLSSKKAKAPIQRRRPPQRPRRCKRRCRTFRRPSRDCCRSWIPAVPWLLGMSSCLPTWKIIPVDVSG